MVSTVLTGRLSMSLKEQHSTVLVVDVSWRLQVRRRPITTSVFGLCTKSYHRRVTKGMRQSTLLVKLHLLPRNQLFITSFITLYYRGLSSSLFHSILFCTRKFLDVSLKHSYVCLPASTQSCQSYPRKGPMQRHWWWSRWHNW